MLRVKVPVKYTSEVKVRWEGQGGGVGTSSRHNSYKVNFDTPREFGGLDRYPCPNEYFLIGVGACIVNTFNFICSNFKRFLKDVQVDLRCESVLKGQSYEVERIDIDFKLEVSEDTVKNSIRRLALLAFNNCHLVKILKKSGIDLKFNITIT